MRSPSSRRSSSQKTSRRSRAPRSASRAEPRPDTRRNAGAGLQARRQGRDARGIRHRARQARRRRSRASSRSTPTSRTPRSPSSSRRSHPDRFYENFIAEQAMIGAAMGLAARGAIPFPVDLRRLPDPRRRLRPDGGDQRRQHQDGRLACRRVDRRGRPVADGARGLRDDAARSPTSPCSIRATRWAPSGWSPRWPATTVRCYMRTSRPKTPVIYGADETVPDRRAQGAAQSDTDVATVVGAGITLFEALKAYDKLQKPRASPSA